LIASPGRIARVAAAIVLGAVIGCSPTLALAQLPYLEVPRYEPKNTAIVMDARTGEILYSERADSPRYPASVTKVMTFYLAFEALASGRLHLNDQIIISPLAASQPPTKLGLRSGETISVENALSGMAVHSANDMAMAIAEHIGGTESRFAQMMNLKAQQLGMANTHFVNPNGLPDSRHISSAHDIAILTRAVLRDYPQYYRFFSEEQFSYRGRTYDNTNHLLGKMPGVDGVKTGFTNAAGSNLDASAVRNGHRLIVVVLGSPSRAMRDSDVENLLLTGFDIMDRRDRGERVQLTQNMFGGTHIGGAVTALTPGVESEGEGDADPIGVVLTRTTQTSGPLAVSQTMPAARPAAHVRGNWWVQVGEFRDKPDARAQVEQVARRFTQQFDDAEGTVDSSGRAYRARFTGFTEAAAREACGAVRAQGVPCAVGGPT